MTNHIKNIDIKNFKCFKDFKVEGLARVNLITGQNNVGKTALLEAIFSNTSTTLNDFYIRLYKIKFRRELLNLFMSGKKIDIILPFLEQAHGFEVVSNIKKTKFSVEQKNGVINYIFDKHWIIRLILRLASSVLNLKNLTKIAKY